MEFIHHLDLLLRARFTLICINTYEEERILENILTLCEKSKRQCYLWDHADFFQALMESPAELPRARDPFTVLEKIDKMDGEIAFTQRYAYHVAIDTLKEQNFEMIEESVERGDTIHLTLRRMVG